MSSAEARAQLVAPPPAAPAPAEEDAAWASVDVAAPASTLFELVRDPLRLLRLNPCLEIEAWRAEPGEDPAQQSFRLVMVNESNGLRSDRRVLVITHAPATICLQYDGGLKESTEVTVTGKGNDQSQLLIRERYRTPPARERKLRLKEVDRSLVPWAAAIQQHVAGLRRWGWAPFYRLYRERFWLGLTPRQRRIAGMLVWISIAEFVLFLVVLAAFLAYRNLAP